MVATVSRTLRDLRARASWAWAAVEHANAVLKRVRSGTSPVSEDWVALQTRHGEGETRHKRKVLTTAINRSIMMSRQL